MRHLVSVRLFTVTGALVLLASSTALMFACGEDSMPVQSSSTSTEFQNLHGRSDTALSMALGTVERDLKTRPPIVKFVTLEQLQQSPGMYDGQRVGITGAPQVWATCELAGCWPLPCCQQCSGQFFLIDWDAEVFWGLTISVELIYEHDDTRWGCAGSRCDFDQNSVDCYPFPHAYRNMDYWFVGIIEDRTPASYPWVIIDMYIEDYGLCTCEM
jgi:hypothetical protein